MLLIKETKAEGEDELINFNQTSIFKCWEMITSTGNKIKGPAIAGWRSVPRETSKFIPAWLKLQIWPKWSTELNALRTTLILSCKFPQCLLGATTAPREEIKAKRILILSNHNTFSHTPIYTHRQTDRSIQHLAIHNGFNQDPSRRKTTKGLFLQQKPQQPETNLELFGFYFIYRNRPSIPGSSR